MLMMFAGHQEFCHAACKNGVRINSVNPGYVLTDVYGKNFAPVRRSPILNIMLSRNRMSLLLQQLVHDPRQNASWLMLVRLLWH